MGGDLESTRSATKFRLCSSCFLLSKLTTMTFKKVVVVVVFLCVTSSSTALKAQLNHRERRGLSRPPVMSYWGDWGSWSACSRTCGGGVAAQTRRCLMRTRGDGGALRESTHCVGLYKQYKLCNSEPCEDIMDYRQQQCERHNDIPFMGTLYHWKTIYKEANLCELNCKAIGLNFFAKLADKVVDGTPCRNTSNAEICVDGMCKAIGCDGILGSGLKLDKCGVCGGRNDQCEVMSGVYTSNSMGHGYHKITTIPTGAMYINITELTKSRNYLALEGSNGNKYINMDWKIDAPGNYSIAGTYFIYKRSPGRTGVGEQLFADGPITEDLNLILINQQRNPGISYEYSVPKATPVISDPVEEEIPEPEPTQAGPLRSNVNIKQDAPPSKSQVSGGVSLSTFLNAGHSAPVFPSTGLKQDRPVKPEAQRPVEPQDPRPVEPQPQRPVEPQAQRPVEPQPQRPVEPQRQRPEEPQPQRPVEPQPQRPVEPQPQRPVKPQAQRPVEPQKQNPIQPSQEEGTSFGPDVVDALQQEQAGQQQQQTDGQGVIGGQQEKGQGRGRGQSEGDGGSPPSEQEFPQADSGYPPYQGSPLRGPLTQGRTLPDSVYQQTVSGREQTGGQGQTYPSQGRNPMYPTQGDDSNPGHGAGIGRPFVPQNAKPNPYPSRYQTYNPGQDPAPNSDPYYPNANRNPYPNSNSNPYPNRNPYPNQNPGQYPNTNPYPNGGQRTYPNANPNTNPYRNPNANPNPYPANPNPNPVNPNNNPYPSYQYPGNQDSQGRQPPAGPQDPQSPFLEMDPIESRRGNSDGSSSTLGSSDFSALEGGRFGGRETAQVRYGWIDAGLTECSASCAGGIQQTKIDCIEWRTFRPQDPSLCDGIRKPNMRQQSCNMDACPPVWEVTEWMECSRTCGTGRRMRQVTCKQRLTPALTTMVPAERCDSRLEPERVQDCTLDPCTSWSTGEWGECDVACGEGQREREVRCVNDAQERLDESACADKKHLKPRSEETCDMGACISNWFVSEWNDLCSVECGGGHKNRYVVCTMEGNSGVLSDEACNTVTKPRTFRTCNNMPCGPVWLVSEWSQCSKECGYGTQERMVLCTGANEPHNIVNEEQCSMKPKPDTRQACNLKDCQAMWFNSDWTQCSRTCGGGQRKRDVKCLDTNMDPSSQCSEDLKPSAVQSCNIQQCTAHIPESGCEDKFHYCEKVAKARLCSYMYYRNNCCYSCFSHRR